MKAHLTLAFALLLVCTGAALAQTPDGLPPALETVCDMETGSAYGHCNAYCEAMDCELANDSDPLTEPHASATACAKVRSKFQQTTGHDVPCEVSCPCTTSPEFNALVESTQYCLNYFDNVVVSPGPIVIPFPPFFEEYAFASQPRPDSVCGYGNFGGDALALPITPEQAAVCTQILNDAIASNGLTCQTFP